MTTHSDLTEVERLRLEIDGWQAALRCKEGECARYRKALESISEYVHDGDDRHRVMAAVMRDEARKALDA